MPRNSLDIQTTFVNPPIPIRSFDWCAVDANTYMGTREPVGTGETEQEAVDDLLTQLEEKAIEEAKEKYEMLCVLSRPDRFEME